jgi:hypothetical protein
MRGDNTQARSCLLRALSLTTHPQLQAYLRTRLRLYDHSRAGEEPGNGAL